MKFSVCKIDALTKMLSTTSTADATISPVRTQTMRWMITTQLLPLQLCLLRLFSVHNPESHHADIACWRKDCVGRELFACDTNFLKT
mgnify:CR=1 FL=1